MGNTRYVYADIVSQKKFVKIGQEYSINTDAIYPYKPPRYGQYGEGKTTKSQLKFQKKTEKQNLPQQTTTNT